MEQHIFTLKTFFSEILSLYPPVEKCSQRNAVGPLIYYPGVIYFNSTKKR